ncbi:cupredoxin family protein [uncultured Jannaschia sp.]|uniref:cupredoxin domain-containing protein n=1 Tax=Jannaschia halovivens TaxID=3388667 RepID=UPI0026126F9E|nr:cupredoxin family protein [uncultured Jannaschia sp.]
MKKTLMPIAVFGALAAPALADGYHRGPHDGPVLHADAMAIGHPGSPDLVDRTIDVSMLDASDEAMAFDVEALEIERGETIRFVLTNRGGEPHDFVMATPEEIAAHRAEMSGMPDMNHEAVYAARVEPGETATLVWTFANEGAFAFACLIPGHYEAGMRGRLTVS